MSTLTALQEFAKRLDDINSKSAQFSGNSESAKQYRQQLLDLVSQIETGTGKLKSNLNDLDESVSVVESKVDRTTKKVEQLSAKASALSEEITSQLDIADSVFNDSLSNINAGLDQLKTDTELTELSFGELKHSVFKKINDISQSVDIAISAAREAESEYVRLSDELNDAIRLNKSQSIIDGLVDATESAKKSMDMANAKAEQLKKSQVELSSEFDRINTRPSLLSLESKLSQLRLEQEQLNNKLQAGVDLAEVALRAQVKLAQEQVSATQDAIDKSIDAKVNAYLGRDAANEMQEAATNAESEIGKAADSIIESAKKMGGVHRTITESQRKILEARKEIEEAIVKTEELEVKTNNALSGVRQISAAVLKANRDIDSTKDKVNGLNGRFGFAVGELNGIKENATQNNDNSAIDPTALLMALKRDASKTR